MRTQSPQERIDAAVSVRPRPTEPPTSDAEADTVVVLTRLELLSLYQAARYVYSRVPEQGWRGVGARDRGIALLDALHECRRALEQEDWMPNEVQL